MSAPNEGLFFDNITKSFGGTQALRCVSIKIGSGEVVALLGENGAGKSTLIKILGGIHSPDAGRVLIDGAPYTHAPAKLSIQQKVAFIHQDLGLIEWMTAAENIALAVGYPRRFGLIDHQASEEIARAALAKVDCTFDPSTRVSNLTRTEKSLLAIARVLAVECDFLVLDEPTASLPADEVERLFKALRPLRDRGVGMIYVSHRLDEVFQIADRVSVLRDGELVGIRDVEHTTPEELVSLIVGRKTRSVERPIAPSEQAVLSVSDLTADGVGPVSLDIHAQEIVGLVGLRGAGQEAIGRSLFGQFPYTGDIKLEGKSIELNSPARAIAQGIGFLARDRIVESVAPSLTIRENLFINPAILGRSMLSFRSNRNEVEDALHVGETLGVNPNDPSLAIEALSGGNQQKVVVGRWANTGRKLLIAEDPTAGVDVGAKAEIYALLFESLKSGMGVLVISTDFEEVAAICHRAIVFSRGQVITELSGTALSTASLIAAASATDSDSHKTSGASVHAVA